MLSLSKHGSRKRNGRARVCRCRGAAPTPALHTWCIAVRLTSLVAMPFYPPHRHGPSGRRRGPSRRFIRQPRHEGNRAMICRPNEPGRASPPRRGVLAPCLLAAALSLGLAVAARADEDLSRLKGTGEV